MSEPLFKKGDIVRFAPEWCEPGEESARMVIIEETTDERGPLPRVLVADVEDAGKLVIPAERVAVGMLILVSRP